MSAAGSANNRGLVVRMDLDLNTRRWAKVLQTGNDIQVVEAVAIKKSSEDQVVLWGRKIVSGSNNSDGHRAGNLIVLYTADGAMVNA